MAANSRYPNRDDLKDIVRVEQLVRQLVDEQDRLKGEIERLNKATPSGGGASTYKLTDSDYARIRSELAAGGRFPLPLTALPGTAAAPQKTKITEYDVQPNVNDPANYDGLVIRVGTTLYAFESGTPGSWVAIGASGDMNVRINSAGVGTQQPLLNVIAGSRRLGLSLVNDGANSELDLTLSLPATQYYSTGVSGGTFTVPTGSWTPLDHTTESWDTDNFWVVGNPERITLANAGLYLATGFVRWVPEGGGVASGVRGLRIVVNGSSVYMEDTCVPVVGEHVSNAGATLLVAAVNDYVSLEGYQTTGADLDTFTFALNVVQLF